MAEEGRPGKRRKPARATARKAAKKRAPPPRDRVAFRAVSHDPNAPSMQQTIEGARTIIFVHGIGNKPLPSVLKCQWDHALFSFDLGERSRLAYWVSRAHYPDPSKETCESGDLTRMEEEPTGRGLSLMEHIERAPLEAEVRAVTDKKSQQDVLLRIARQISDHTPGPQSRTVAVQGVEASVLPLPRFVREWITRKLTRAFLRDVNDYFFDAQRREVMRESVLSRLRVGGGPFVVVAHSQGSMIAYDVLSQLDPTRFDIPLFVTIGSPLGMQEVQDQVKRLTKQKRLAIPACVRNWINVADPLDPVALDKRLAGDFTPVGQIDDKLRFNPDSPRHPHSATGYLRLTAVRDAVRDAVDTALFQPVARFVVARDVVRELENHPPVTRHKILIELAEPAAGTVARLDDLRDTVVGHIQTQAKTASEAELSIESLQRFVAARLTREETERLANELSRDLPGIAKSVDRVWRNSEKAALLTSSINTVQVAPAHIGYNALGQDITWAVLDTGVNAAHPHFRSFANIAAQYDCTVLGPLQDGGEAPDEHGHGTHVAGVIAGRLEVPMNGGPPRVFSGMAPQAKLWVYRVLDRRGSGEDAWIIKALDHIASTNDGAGRLVVHGVNLSLGGSFDPSVYACGFTPLCRELRRLWRQGVLVVMAAGNEGFAVLQTLDGTVDANMPLSISDPANLEDSIGVGSVHKDNPHSYGISYFSSRGPTADGRQKPDLVAPGERILSCRHAHAIPAPMLDPLPPGQATVDQLYVEMSGTSMAAPHVSGLLAAFLSARREFVGEPDRVKRILRSNCTDLERERSQQGAGLPNLVKMLVNT